jgi:uncharacterized membrane protein
MPKNVNWTDRRIEDIIGNLLRAGVLLAAAVVLIGGMVFLLHHAHAKPDYGAFHGESGDLRSVSGIIRDTLKGQGRGIIQLGLLLLILTPIARVAFSAVAFALERDRLYVIITLTVLTLLLLSLTGRLL